MLIVALGGLSESGKSSVGLYLQQNGFERVKIVSIEREMMVERGIIKPHDILKERHFDILYKNMLEACEDFWKKLKVRMDKVNSQYATIESIYRPELSSFLKQKLKERYLFLYFEAPFSSRVAREYQRLLKEQSCENIDLETVTEQVRKKDGFKIKHQANQIKQIADYIIYNTGTEEALYKKVDAIIKNDLNFDNF